MSIGNSQLSPCQEEKEPKREPSFTCTVRGHAAADSRRTNGRRAESGRGEGKGRERAGRKETSGDVFIEKNGASHSFTVRLSATGVGVMELLGSPV